MIHEHPFQSCRKTPCNLSKVNTDTALRVPTIRVWPAARFLGLGGTLARQWLGSGEAGPEYSQILTQFLHILPSPAGGPECSEWYRGVSVKHVSNCNMFWQLFELHLGFSDTWKSTSMYTFALVENQLDKFLTPPAWVVVGQSAHAAVLSWLFQCRFWQ